MACSTEALLPQAQVVGMLAGVQPYPSASASWKAPLCKVKPCSSRGRVVSQVEEPCTVASSIAHLHCVVQLHPQYISYSFGLGAVLRFDVILGLHLA